jgi:hypothetical protein
MPTFTAIVPPKEILIALGKYAGSSKQVLMLTGSSSQRKCHLRLHAELQTVSSIHAGVISM